MPVLPGQHGRYRILGLMAHQFRNIVNKLVLEKKKYKKEEAFFIYSPNFEEKKGEFYNLASLGCI